MKPLNATLNSKSGKQEREKKVLLGLTEQYIKTGLPVGSNSLKEAGFDELSSATIRNYFSELEKQGFLAQLHTSSGRIPTQKAFRLYALEHVESPLSPNEHDRTLDSIRNSETKGIALYLQQAAETLSHLTSCAIFLSAPRFDHDFVIDLKLVPVDYNRFLCVIITDFGIIRTELLHTEETLSPFLIKRIEGYFHWRLSGHDKPERLNEEEEALAQKFYNELMLRYIVGYSTFIEEEVYRTGFSKLLRYTDFHDAHTLASSLALFESSHTMRLLLKDCCAHDILKFWIGDDLSSFGKEKQRCTVLSIPYKINQQTVGAIGLLGPIRMPYKELFGLLRSFSECISEGLARHVYKYKISFRTPEEGMTYLEKEEKQTIGQTQLMLLEDQSKRVH